jgi:hypothetical protein
MAGGDLANVAVRIALRLNRVIGPESKGVEMSKQTIVGITPLCVIATLWRCWRAN